MGKRKSTSHNNDLLRQGGTVASQTVRNIFSEVFRFSRIFGERPVLLGLAAAGFCLNISAYSAEISDATLMEYRNKLSARVQSELEAICGNHCPSFRIDAQSTKKPKKSIDELGFPDPGSPTEKASAPEKIVVEILADEFVTPAQVSSLKQILSHSLGNMIAEPVGVEVKKIRGIGEHLLRPYNRTPDFFDRFQQLQSGFWPVTSMVLGILVLTAILLVGFFTRGILRDHLGRKGEDDKTGEAAAAESARPVAELDVDLEKVLADRTEDIRWFVDTSARDGKHDELQRTLAIIPSARLAGQVSLQPQTLATLSEITVPQVQVPKEEDKAWLVTALDQALWQRLHFESRPLARADFLSSYELQKLMTSLSSRQEKALLLSNVKRDKWASALVHLPSTERIEVGLLLQEIELGQLPAQEELERNLLDKLQRSGLNESRFGHLVDDYSLYLDESEGRALMNRLSLKPRRGFQGQSLEGILEKLSDHLLLDLCLRANVKELQVLFPTLPKPTQDRILRTVPEHLRGRIARFTQDQDLELPDDTALLGARASLLSMTRGMNLLGPAGGQV